MRHKIIELKCWAEVRNLESRGYTVLWSLIKSEGVTVCVKQTKTVLALVKQ